MRTKLLVASLLLASTVMVPPALAFRGNGGWGFRHPGFAFNHFGFRRDFDRDFDDRRFGFRRGFGFGRPFFGRPFAYAPVGYAYAPYPYYYPPMPYYPGYYGY